MELAGTTTETVTAGKTYVAQFRVIFVHHNFQEYLRFTERFEEYLQVEYFDTPAGALEALRENYPADVIVAHDASGGVELLDTIRSSTGFGNIPFVLLVDRLSRQAIDLARARHADDVFSVNFDDGDLITRIKYFKKR